MSIFSLFSDSKSVSGIKEQYIEASGNDTNFVRKFNVCDTYYTMCVCVCVYYMGFVFNAVN